MQTLKRRPNAKAAALPRQAARARHMLLIGALLLLVAAWLAVFFLVTGPAQAQEGSEQQLEQGARLYNENCAPCHGPNGEGRVGATLAKDWPSIRPDLLVRSTIEQGVAGSPMPAWSTSFGGPLIDDEISALVAYILSWQSGGFQPVTPFPTLTSRPPITPIPGVEGDPNRGAQLFDQNCDLCHGPNGEGRIGATLAKPWSSVRADLVIKSTIQNGVSGSPMPAWGVDMGGPLGEQDVNDLVAFILTLPNIGSVGALQPTPAPEAGTVSSWAALLVLLVLFGLMVTMILLTQRKRT